MEVKEVWTMRDRPGEIDSILEYGIKIDNISSAGTLRVKNHESFTHLQYFQYVPDIVEKVLNDKDRGNNGK
jgi:hypothetical protein